MKNKHDAILELTPENSGLLVELKSGNLRNSKMINKYTVPEYARNDDNVCLKCIDCNEWMGYHHGPKRLLDGYWRCPNCQKKITETRAYGSIENENRKWSEKWEDEY